MGMWSVRTGATLGVALVLGTGGLDAQELPAGGTEIQFETSDGLTVYGDLFGSPDSDGPLILLFHQGGGDGRGEYAPILPRLLAEGYDALIIDQRSGGNLFGGVNRTVAELEEEGEYCDAAPEIEGALDFVLDRGFSGPIIAWGSSYSGTLALNLALDRPDDLVGVLGFSPAAGGPLERCAAEPRAAQMRVPTLILRPDAEMENGSARAQMATWAEHGHGTFVASPGRHGSSMLVESRVGSPTDETWDFVLGFLQEALARYDSAR